MDNGASSYRRFLDGDDSGIAEIIQEYKDGLLLYLTGIVGSITVAEELMEDTFFKLVVKKPRFSNQNSFKTWLYTVGRNMALDELRRRKKISDMPIEDYENELSETTYLEQFYIKEERKVALHHALSKLKSEYAQVLHLIYFEDFSNAQAAAVMKKSRHQIENLIYRAKKSLKSTLEKEGFIYEEL